MDFYFYCVAPELDYWLRTISGGEAHTAASTIDSSLFSAVAGFLYEGALDHHATRRRISLPARKHGLGIRSRVDLAPVAFIAGFTEAAERFLDRDLGGGITSPGFFTMLEPLFGAGAFDQHGHRLSRFLDGPSPTAAMYDDLWYNISQAYTRHVGAPPTDGPLASARGWLGADGSQKLQHRLTVQLEDAAYHSLDDHLRSLPHCQIRHAWLQLDALSQQWVTSWPSAEHAIAPVEFSEVMATYLGEESPLVRGAWSRRRAHS